MIYYDPFVLPFSIGLTVLLLFLCIRFTLWIKDFSPSERRLIRRHLFSLRTLKAIGEIISESLIHRKIFKHNVRLGYMHMCFGLGWFLLIVVGKIESLVYHTNPFNPPYFAIFFRYFHPAKETFPFSDQFAFVMDLLLLIILSGLILAITKRFFSKSVGMRKTTRHSRFDLIVLSILWSIFPLRFLAESFTSGVRGGGSFLTHNAGDLFNHILPIEQMNYGVWWLYSSALGLFFILLPHSRYMHIPTEIVHIFLKRWGIRPGKTFTPISNFHLYACSRCGICIDQCQLGNVLGHHDTQAIYFLKKLRNRESVADSAQDCLMCGRCQQACPVDLSLLNLRYSQRPDYSIITKESYHYLAPVTAECHKKIAYFAGCMGHLTPSVFTAMEYIFHKAKVDYSFIDKEGSICCGRPMQLSGNKALASLLIEKNKTLIEESGALCLITSCPICYKVFKEEYHLSIPVFHHSEYIYQLIDSGKLPVRIQTLRTLFHSPCELGRGLKVYQAPNEVLKRVSTPIASSYDNENALCCGGSLANNTITQADKRKLTLDAYQKYGQYKPDLLVTACPLCKKSFAQVQYEFPVQDIAEVVAQSC